MKVQATLKNTFTGHDGPVYTLEQGGDQNSFFSGSGDKLVSTWSFDLTTEPKALVNVGAIVYSVCHLDELNCLLVGESSGGLHVVDLEKKQEIRFIKHHSGGIFDILYSKKNKHVYTVSADGTIAIWDSENFTLLRSVSLCKEKVRSLSLDRNESELAIACGDGQIRILDIDKLQIRHSFHAHDLSANVVSYHPEQNILLSGGRDAILNFWDRDSYQLIKSIPAHNYAIYSIDFSPDAQLIATGSRDKTVKIWDADKLDFLLRIDRENHDGHQFSVNKVLWAKENGLLLSAGDDKSIKLWSVTRA
jgi:WD40 repeat protein